VKEEIKAVRAAVMKMNVEGKKGTGRQKKRFWDTFSNDIKAADVEGDVEDRDKLRSRTSVVDLK